LESGFTSTMGMEGRKRLLSGRSGAQAKILVFDRYRSLFACSTNSKEYF
jgi:hypothetical protein